MRRLALMGAAKGPCVSARGIQRPHVKVSDLPEGGVVSVSMSNGETLVVPSNGIHSLGFDQIEWVEVSCLAAKGHRTICEIISVRAA